MNLKTTIHVLVINNYFPEMTKLTIPTVERWAKKLNARLNIITNRKWPEWPLLYEKMQIYYDGADSDWNVLMDADILVHPDTPNPLGSLIAPVQVASKDCYNADRQLVMDDYFFRDGRNIGISTCAVAASRICHDLWTPLDMPLEVAVTKVYKQRDILDEYCVSRNLARYGLKFTAFLDPALHYDKVYHLGAFGRDKNQMMDEAKEWYKKNWR